MKVTGEAVAVKLKRIIVVAAGCLAVALLGGQAKADTATDWTGYLRSPEHSSYNASDTAITPGNVGQLTQTWKWRGDAATMPGQPGPAVYATPIVAGGSVYIGANNGYFYKLDEATGVVRAKVFIGFRPKLTCLARGLFATAAVAPDPVTGEQTVYVAAPDGYLYALRASDLATRWRSVIDIPSRTVSDYFQWSSPTVANGKIYVGSASQCDKPLTRGAVVAFDQGTGVELARFFSVPAGVLGGGVWSTVAVDSGGYVYASTGTQPKNTTNRYDAVSIVKLDGSTLQKVASFRVADSELVGDGDFGGSPTIFGTHVGACNKNGIYYALDRATMQLDWQVRLGSKPDKTTSAQCSSTAAWDGTSLYFAGNPTTIRGTAYRGSVRRIDPETGAFLWQTGLPNAVISAATLSGGGVIAVGTYDSTTTPSTLYLLDATTGKVLRTLTSGGNTFGQSVFADGHLFSPNIGQGLRMFSLP